MEFAPLYLDVIIRQTRRDLEIGILPFQYFQTEVELPADVANRLVPQFFIDRHSPLLIRPTLGPDFRIMQLDLATTWESLDPWTRQFLFHEMQLLFTEPGNTFQEKFLKLLESYPFLQRLRSIAEGCISELQIGSETLTARMGALEVAWAAWQGILQQLEEYDFFRIDFAKECMLDEPVIAGLTPHMHDRVCHLFELYSRYRRLRMETIISLESATTPLIELERQLPSGERFELLDDLRFWIAAGILTLENPRSIDQLTKKTRKRLGAIT